MRISRLKPLFVIASGGGALFAGHALYSGNAKFYAQVVMPTIHRFTTAETAHNLAISCAKNGLYPRCKNDDVNTENLSVSVLSHKFSNPIGLAAGFDKHCEAVDSLLNFGFGFIEVGGVTPEPQPGNEKPRVFRLEEDGAVINRYGFNSCGHVAAAARLEQWCARKENRGDLTGLVGVNLGKNKTTTDAAADYVKGVEVFGPLADFLVVNVSSPNTPGLRQLQGKEQLRQIVSVVVDARNQLERSPKPPILIKIAPDLTEKDKIDIATVVAAKDSGIHGLIISNTTITRPSNLANSNRSEMGGLSGAPLRSISTEAIKDMYRLTSGKLTIIGVGGVFTGADALEKIKAGASLVQIYTSLAYLGPPVVNQIKKELSELLEKEGYDNVQQAIGVDALAL